MEAVITIVLILLAVSSVVVTVDIHWAVMDLTVMVSYSFVHLVYLLYYKDINECDMGTDTCHHNCNNTVGSYICHCDGGYQLVSGLSCSGKFN